MPMEPRGIVKAFPKRKKVRDDSGKSIPPKILKEEGTEIPEGKSYVPMMWDIILIPSVLTASAVPQRLLLALSVFSAEVASLAWCVQLEPPKECLPGLVPSSPM